MYEFIQHFDFAHWVETIGYVGILLIIFVESGLFVGFFLPGDSLLFIAGMLAEKGIFDITILVPAMIVTAIAGYMLGFWFGDKLGHWLLKRKDSLFFKKRYLTQAHAFYEKHGGKALVLGRLVPIVRTFAPIVAGMADMPYRRYFFYNVLGALVWCGGVTLLGFFIGGILPNAEHYLLPAIVIVILLSILPGVIHFLRNWLKEKFKSE